MKSEWISVNEPPSEPMFVWLWVGDKKIATAVIGVFNGEKFIDICYAMDISSTIKINFWQEIKLPEPPKM